MSSKDITEQDPIAIAYQAERDLNSHEAKTGHGDLDRSSRHGKGPSDSSNHLSPFSSQFTPSLEP